MRHFTRCLALLTAAVLLSCLPALAAGGGEYLPDNPLAGQKLFSSKHCIKCHSIQGSGGQAGPDLGEMRVGSLTSIIGSLWNHFPKMIETFEREGLEWPKLTPQQAQELFTFIYFLNFFDKNADPVIGKRIFLEKNCIRCHSVGGRGGDVGPELDPFQADYAAAFITSALWNSGPKMMETMEKRAIPRPQFQEGDVLDILAYIRSAGFSASPERRYLRPANPAKGKQVFAKKNCVKCHAVRGAGGKVGPDLSGRDLKVNVSQIMSAMWNHGSNMWPRMQKQGIAFPEFKPEEMSDLMAYLYFIQFGDKPGSRARGQVVFAEKRCKDCHVPSKPGAEAIGPNLAEAGLDSLFDVVAAIWNHAPAIREKMGEEHIRWPILEEDEVRDLLEYIMALE